MDPANTAMKSQPRDIFQSQKQRRAIRNLRLGKIVHPPKKHVVVKVRSSTYSVAVPAGNKKQT